MDAPQRSVSDVRAFAEAGAGTRRVEPEPADGLRLLPVRPMQGGFKSDSNQGGHASHCVAFEFYFLLFGCVRVWLSALPTFYR